MTMCGKVVVMYDVWRGRRTGSGFGCKNGNLVDKSIDFFDNVCYDENKPENRCLVLRW